MICQVLKRFHLVESSKYGFFDILCFLQKNWRFPAKKPSTAPHIDSFVELLKTSSDCHLLLSSEKYIYLYKRLEFYLHNWHEIQQVPGQILLLDIMNRGWHFHCTRLVKQGASLLVCLKLLMSQSVYTLSRDGNKYKAY